jgi:2-amino-4-hydroxy-6-hydroxymethyldihydropteridine diphosphokinase
MDAAASRSGPTTAWIALGSNLGDRQQNLRAAVAGLRAESGIEVVAVSRVYETDPVGPPPQGPYLNAVARVQTTLAPRELLALLLGIECSRGRRRSGQRNAPRTLDLDLLLYGDERIDADGLIVPHPRLHERAFVLEPLSEVAAGVTHPVLRESIAELARRLRDPAGVRLSKETDIFGEEFF